MSFIFLTFAAESVGGKGKPRPAGADVRARYVGADVLTEMQGFVAFMDLWKRIKVLQHNHCSHRSQWKRINCLHCS